MSSETEMVTKVGQRLEKHKLVLPVLPNIAAKIMTMEGSYVKLSHMQAFRHVSPSRDCWHDFQL